MREIVDDLFLEIRIPQMTTREEKEDILRENRSLKEKVYGYIDEDCFSDTAHLLMFIRKHLAYLIREDQPKTTKIRRLKI